KQQTKRNRFHTHKANIISKMPSQSQLPHPPLVKNRADKKQNEIRQIIFATENKTQICVILGESD
ncbi:MAG: hypothetical protein II671_00315, partial [Salinivirgaceae bacterium]|nr:hypothetical protein [Salinivirgaceae bacterium]